MNESPARITVRNIEGRIAHYETKVRQIESSLARLRAALQYEVAIERSEGFVDAGSLTDAGLASLLAEA